MSNRIAPLALAGLIAIAFAASTASRVEARPGVVETCTYYSDSTHHTIVGTCFITCNAIKCTGMETNFFHCTVPQYCLASLSPERPADSSAFLASLAPERTPEVVR